VNRFFSVVRNRLLVYVAALVVLATTFGLVSGGDIRPAAAETNPGIATVTLNGVAAPAGDYATSTVSLCPRSTALRARLFDKRTMKPRGSRAYTIYWRNAQSSVWHSRHGETGPAGRIRRIHLAGRLAEIQVSAEGYNHTFHVRYRSCAASAGSLQTSTLYGVRGKPDPYVRVKGAVSFQRSDGTTRPFAGGRVAVRNSSTGQVLATTQAGAQGAFHVAVPVAATTSLSVAPVAGPGVSATRPIAYGASWQLQPAETARIAVPSWMRRRHVTYTPSASFSPQLKTYVGDFADPTVMRVGKTYYAAATTSSNLNLPLLTSTDLRTWHPRAPLSNYFDYSSWPQYNDALPGAPKWAARVSTRENVKRISQWAPSLARIGKHRYLAAFSAATRVTVGDNRRSCIGLAVASSPDGPYQPLAKPLLCDPSTFFGVIDPSIFVDPRTHHIYLAWAAEGIPHQRKGQLAIRRLNNKGTGWARGSRRHNLLTFTQPWEGVIVENPSMIRYRGTLYLFYSANAYATSRYATGYAICRSVAGPCTKPRRTPLLSSKRKIAGPGGADAFVDTQGRLRLAYAAWQRGHVGQLAPGRKLHIATLKRNAHTHRLSVKKLSQ